MVIHGDGGHLDLFSSLATELLQALPCPCNGVPFVMQQLLDGQQPLYVFPPVSTLRTPSRSRVKVELLLPVPQHVGLETRDATDFPDTVIELIGISRLAMRHKDTLHELRSFFSV